MSPYGVVYSRGNYYLLGHHKHTNEKRIYRIDKITDIKINEKYEYVKNKDEDLKNYIKNSAFMHINENKINIKLRCKRKVLSGIIERSEDCNLSEDKENRDYFYATILDTTHLVMKYWVLEYGSDCEVIKPKELREDMKKTLKEALELYEGEGDM